MKKFVALLLALTLVAASVVSAMAYNTEANMKKWVDVDLEGYKVVQLFNYNETIAIDVDGKTVTYWQVTKDYTDWNGYSIDDWDLPATGTDYRRDTVLPTGASDTVDYGPDGLYLGGSGAGPAYEVDSPNYPGNVIPVYQAVGEATLWAQNTVAKEETNPHGKSEPRDAAYDIRYVISSTYVAGFEANEVVGNGATLNVVPVDLTVEENTAFVYPIATKSHVVIGLLFAKVNVEEGFVQIELQYKDELYKDYGTTQTVYTTKAQLIDGSAANFELAEPISIEEELGGAPAIMISIAGKVTYPTLFGNLKSGKWLSYQDYFRYEKWVKTYRTNMTAALALVAD